MEYWTLSFSGGKPVTKIEDLPNYENLKGFVYKITDKTTGKFYIGKKSLHHTRKSKISQKEIKETGTRKKIKRTVKESDWLKYYGSSKDLKADIKTFGASNYTREILVLCCTAKFLSYCEISHQMKMDVLTANSYNGNILGRYYARDMINCE
jgi:hypothetical protein